MNKFKKYIYPLVFCIGFIVFWATTVTIINAIPSEDGYGGLGLGILILLAWICVFIPIYCIRYSKIIINEKLKFIFPFYNAFVLSFLYLLPFSLEDETYIYASILFVWVLFWTFVPLCIKLDSIKKQEENNLDDAQ